VKIVFALTVCITVAVGPVAAAAPALSFSTTFGGTGDDQARDVTVDSAGFIYVVGDTSSGDFPVWDPVQAHPPFPNGTLQPRHIFVTKLDPTGSTILFSTYLGGSVGESARKIAVDSNDYIYVAGSTVSWDFPITSGALRPTGAPNGRDDITLTKLSASGSLVYSAVIGGVNDDEVAGLAVDGAGNCFLTGSTNSPDFPTTPGARNDLAKLNDLYSTAKVFVMKVNASGTALLYSSVFGGSGADEAAALSIDPSGAALIAGNTTSADFPTTSGAYRSASKPSEANRKGFIAKFSADGSVVQFATYLGGSASEQITGIALDDSGRIYVTGLTTSPDFPVTPGAYLAPVSGSSNAVFVARFVAEGASLDYSAVFGGSSNRVAGIAVDSNGQAVVAGSVDFRFPVIAGAPQIYPGTGASSNRQATNAFILKLNGTGSAPVFSTYLGGTNATAAAVALDSEGQAIVGGTGDSTFPVTPGNRAFNPGEIFVAKLSDTSSCTYTVQALSALSATVSTQSDCKWIAVSGVPWLTVSRGNFGSDTGTVQIIAQQNTGLPRSGMLSLAGSLFTVNQPSGCQLTLSSTSQAFSSDGGSDQFSGFTTYGCAIPAASTSAPWIHVHVDTRSAELVFEYSVDRNTTGQFRSAFISVGSRSFAVTQSFTPCSYSVSLISSQTSGPTTNQRISIGATSLVASLRVQTQGGCVWTASSTAPWIAITSAASFSGSGTATLTVDVNHGGPRFGSIEAAGQVITLKQDQRALASQPSYPAVWRPWNGTWYLLRTGDRANPVLQQWGLPGDIPVPADYDGDGQTDLAVWRPWSGTWYVVPSSNPGGAYSRQWGLPGDVPVPADYDTDGRTDFAVWRPGDGSWYVVPSSNPANAYVQQWGLSGDIPVPADYDGDGRTDFAVWRPADGSWYVIRTSQPVTPYVIQWGLSGDVPVPGDYDGDGRTDLAVWRPATGSWFVVPTSSPSHPSVLQWGLSGDVPVPADYDGDGKIDLTVWRPANGNWYVMPGSNTTSPYALQWGLRGDVPLAKAP
jgi:hypothetical protein